MKRRKFDKTFKQMALTFKLLSHEDRLRILGLIHEEELGVSQLSRLTQISQSAVSQHLKLLKLNHLVKERRCGKNVYYVSSTPTINKIMLASLDLELKNHDDDNRDKELAEEMRSLLS